jgi:hypothetical protein
MLWGRGACTGPLISIGIRKKNTEPFTTGAGTSTPPLYFMAWQQVMHGCLDGSVACAKGWWVSVLSSPLVGMCHVYFPSRYMRSSYWAECLGMPPPPLHYTCAHPSPLSGIYKWNYTTLHRHRFILSGFIYVWIFFLYPVIWTWTDLWTLSYILYYTRILCSDYSPRQGNRVFPSQVCHCACPSA